MADTIRLVDYWHVTVPNKPGEGLRVMDSIKKAGVDLLSFTAFPVAGPQAQLAFVPEPSHAERLWKAAAAAGLTLSQKKQAILVQGKSRIGAVAEVLRRLAEAKVNVHAANAAVAPEGGFGLIIWTKTEDELREAMRALKEGGSVGPWPKGD
jgi:hypothetical protein